MTFPLPSQKHLALSVPPEGLRAFAHGARARVARGLLLGTLALTGAGVVSAATVDFKLTPGLKGREQRVAAQLAQSLGASDLTSTGGGAFSVTVADDAKAASVATALRERSSVLWAQAAKADAPLNRPVPETEYHSRMLALTLKDPATAPAVIARLAARTGHVLKLKRVSAGNRALVVMPTGTTAASLAAVSVAATADAGVITSDRVQIARHQWLPNDTMWRQQWSLGTGVGGIRAATAWDMTPSGNVAVAVLDTGIRSHPDLDTKRLAGYDLITDTFISNDEDGRDPDATDSGDYDDSLECTGPWDFMSSWHGTHVAGIIAASTNNGQGMAGVAPGARIVPVRVLGRCGGTFEDISDGIRWAAGLPVAGLPVNPNPVKVMNLSLGGYGACPAAMQNAIDGALANGAIIVVSAGNESALASDFAPANCKGVITVAASNLLGDLSSYSNFGNLVSLSAPGGDGGDLPGVLSTLNGGTTLPSVPSYASYMGTSMASPHVAGVIALMLARDPGLTAGQVLNRLRGGARAFPSGADCAAVSGACGAGLLDAANAVAATGVTRPAADMTGRTDRVRLVEVQNAATGRYALVADPVELAQLTSGQRGALWVRTGFSIDTFSDTAQFNGLAIAQPVCRAKLVFGGSLTYAAATEDCNAFAANSGMVVDGNVFLAAFANSGLCPVGSFPAYEFARQDGLGWNLRTVAAPAEMSAMVNAGWTQSRVAFCAPQ
ncbi:MAG: S8 family peptidase [Burkholderiales bacterium]|nr:S8 family peptidase [Burkholderiales bacterium]